MPSIVEKETIIGSNITRTKDGYTDTAVFFVTGLDAPGAQKKLQAITTPGIPVDGEPHPFIPGIVCKSIPSVKMHKGGFSAFVTAFFATPDDEDSGGGGDGPDGSGSTLGTVRLGAVYERVPSHFAVNPDGSVGAKIKTGIDWEAEIQLDDPAGLPLSGAIEFNGGNSQGAEVDTYISRVTVIKRGNAIKCPLAKAQKTGFTNSDNFLQPIAGLFDGPPDGTPDTWLLIRSSSNSTDNNASFDYEFEWAYNPATWHKIAVFLDPATGRPPANVTRPPAMIPGDRGNGTLVVRVAGQAQFTPFVNLQ